MVSMCEYMGVEVHPLFIDETEAVTGEMVRIFLQKDKNWTSVAIVHSETSSGTVNNVEEVGQLVKKECPGKYILEYTPRPSSIYNLSKWRGNKHPFVNYDKSNHGWQQL